MSSFIRVLFPSWRFFDDIALVPVLWVRFSSEASWTEFLPKIKKRGWGHLFLNAEENERMAVHGLLNRLASDLEDSRDHSVSLELLKNLIMSRGHRWAQFKLTLGGEDLFVSPPIGSAE